MDTKAVITSLLLLLAGCGGKDYDLAEKVRVADAAAVVATRIAEFADAHNRLPTGTAELGPELFVGLEAPRKDDIISWLVREKVRDFPDKPEWLTLRLRVTVESADHRYRSIADAYSAIINSPAPKSK